MPFLTVWPTDAADGAVSSEARWRKMGRTWTPTGVVAGASTELNPSLAGTSLTVKAGAAWIDGHYAELAGDQVLTVTANGLAVIRFDPAANTAELLYRDGATTPNQSPTGQWELPIAKIAASALTDMRAIITPSGGVRVLSIAARDFLFPSATALIGTVVLVDVAGQFRLHSNRTWGALPFVNAGKGTVSTDAFGNWLISTPQANVMLNCYGGNAQRAFPGFHEFNEVDSGIGSTRWIAYTYPTTNAKLNAFIGTQWNIAYT